MSFQSTFEKELVLEARAVRESKQEPAAKLKIEYPLTLFRK